MQSLQVTSEKQGIPGHPRSVRPLEAFQKGSCLAVWRSSLAAGAGG